MTVQVLMQIKAACIIPARSGSKRLPLKNFCRIDHFYLTEYVIQAALSARVFTDIIVSTDEGAPEDYLNACHDAGASIVKRTRTIDDGAAVRQAVDETLDLSYGDEHPNYVCVIYPWAINVRSSSIKEALGVLFESQAHAVYPIKEIGHLYQRIQRGSPFPSASRPYLAMTLHDRHDLPSQDMDPAYVEAVSYVWFNKWGTGDVGYLDPHADSYVDVDTYEDMDRNLAAWVGDTE